MSGLFKAQSYKSLEGVTIGGSCILRRVFTLKSQPPDTTATELTAPSSTPLEEIPRACQIPPNMGTVQTQVQCSNTISAHPVHVCM